MIGFTNIRALRWDNPEHTSASGVADIEGFGTDLPYTFGKLEWPFLMIDIENGVHGDVAEFAEIVPVRPAPMEISDRQFFQLLAIRGLITRQEAMRAVQLGELPAAMQELVGRILDEDAAFAVEIAISGASVFERTHPDTLLLAYLYGWDEADLETFWTEAANLK